MMAWLAGSLLLVLMGGMILRLLFMGRRSEMILVERHSRLQAAMAGLCDGVIVTDQGGRVVFLNPPGERLCGTSRQEATGKPLAHAYRTAGPGIPHAWRDPAAAVLRGDAGCNEAEMLMTGSDGVERPVQMKVSSIKNAAGHTTGVVVIVRDDSERRDRERALVEENRRKDEFLAMLSHELRNPLASILTASEVSACAGEDRPRLGSKAHRPRGQEPGGIAGQPDGRLADDSRQGSDPQATHRRDDRCPSRRAENPARDGLTIPPVRAIHPAHFARLEADPVRLEQILMNLLSNAAKYTPPGGRVEMTAERMDLQIVFRIIDDGIGIASNVLPGVFDLFAQAEAARWIGLRGDWESA